MPYTKYLIYEGKELTDYIIHRHATKLIIIKDKKNNDTNLIYRDFSCPPLKIVIDGKEVQLNYEDMNKPLIEKRIMELADLAQKE